MQSSTWIKGLQLFSDDSRGFLSASSLARPPNNEPTATSEGEQQQDTLEDGTKKTLKKHFSFGQSIKQKLKLGGLNSTGESSESFGSDDLVSASSVVAGMNSPRTKPLPPSKNNSTSPTPLSPRSKQSPSLDASNEVLVKHLQRLKKTNGTPSTPGSVPSNLEISNRSTISGGSSGITSPSDNLITSADKKLFDVVVVVKLRNQGEKLEPFIHYEFPPQNVRSDKDVKLVHTIPLFCCK